MKDREKPEWDSSRPGQPPAITVSWSDYETSAATRLRDQILAEAATIADSASRGLMTKDQKFVESARSREHTHRVNLELFLSLPEEDRRQIFAHRQALAIALYEQGRFEEALAAISDPAGRALEGFADLSNKIVAYREAVWRNDSEDCGCEPVRKTVEIGTNKTVEIQERSRVDVEPILSPKHGKLVSVWQCSLCGFLNAHQGVPENQLRIRELRTSVDQGKLDGSAPDLSDHRLLNRS